MRLDITPATVHLTRGLAMARMRIRPAAVFCTVLLAGAGVSLATGLSALAQEAPGVTTDTGNESTTTTQTFTNSTRVRIYDRTWVYSTINVKQDTLRSDVNVKLNLSLTYDGLDRDGSQSHHDGRRPADGRRAPSSPAPSASCAGAASRCSAVPFSSARPPRSGS